MTFSIPVPTYRLYVNVYCSSDPKKLRKWDSLISKNFDGKSDGFSAIGRSYDIYLNKDGFRCADIVLDKRELTPGLIAHEVLHCVCYIMSYIDIPLTQESEEAYTCLTAYLTDAIYQSKLKKHILNN